MSDGDDTTLATETLLHERLRYQWHAGYDTADEPSDVPNWAILREVSDDAESGVTTFQHRYDPEHIWVRSDLVYDLTEMI